MNPGYTLRVETVVALHKTRRNVTLSFRRLIDFVPINGMKIRFTNDAGEQLDVEFQDVYYDYENKEFVEEQIDTQLIDELRESDGPECTILPERLKEYIEMYESFGWEKVV